MKEILFRGKRADNGEWIEGDLFRNYDRRVFVGELIVTDADVCTCDKYELGIGFVEVRTYTVGQYTGLKDRNGEKIFEGDIVRNDGIAYECHWDDCNFEFGLANENESFGIAYATLDLVVIGNIYDNPELLKGGDT